MKSPEDLSPIKTEIEKSKEEIALKSPEVEIPEISNEDLEQHTIAAESHIEQQPAEILPEGEKRLESSSSSMNISLEMFDSTKEEFGLDAKLQEVQSEAGQIASEARSEIASVAEEPELEKSVEVKQQTPEEIKKGRRMGIIKEIETEWEAKHGPMYRTLSEREIEHNKVMAKLWHKEWDGSTTQLTEQANEFYFDHRGMGKSAVPSKADKILTERFPEYAPKTEQPQQKKQEKAVQKIPEIEVVKLKSETENKAENILKEMVRRIHTEDIPACFKTESGSVYITDTHARSVRFKAEINQVENPSRISVFLDHTYLDQETRFDKDSKYIGKYMVNRDGYLIIDDPTDTFSRVVTKWEDIPEELLDDQKKLHAMLYLATFDSDKKNIVNKTPVSFVPKLGNHPVEFWNEKLHPLHHSNHIGTPITELKLLLKETKEEKARAVEDMLMTVLAKM